MNIEKIEVVEGNLFLKIGEIEKIYNDQDENRAPFECQKTFGGGEVYTILCCAQ